LALPAWGWGPAGLFGPPPAQPDPAPPREATAPGLRL